MKKDFIFGLMTGIALSMTLSMFIFNYYIVSSIERTKEEIRETATSFKEVFKTELKDGIDQLREDGKGFLEERKGEVVERLKERIKNRVAEKDSTKTE